MKSKVGLSIKNLHLLKAVEKYLPFFLAEESKLILSLLGICFLEAALD